MYFAYMNKGVVSRIVEEHADFSEQVENKLKTIFGTQNISIVDDERMPYYIHNGQRVYADAMLNTSGSIRRYSTHQDEYQQSKNRLFVPPLSPRGIQK